MPQTDTHKQNNNGFSLLGINEAHALHVRLTRYLSTTSRDRPKANPPAPSVRKSNRTTAPVTGFVPMCLSGKTCRNRTSSIRNPKRPCRIWSIIARQKNPSFRAFSPPQKAIAVQSHRPTQSQGTFFPGTNRIFLMKSDFYTVPCSLFTYRRPGSHLPRMHRHEREASGQPSLRIMTSLKPFAYSSRLYAFRRVCILISSKS